MKKCILLFITLIVFCLPASYAISNGKIIYVDVDNYGNSYLASISPNGKNKVHLTPAYNDMMFPRYNKKTGWIGFTNKTKNLHSEIYLLNKKRNKIRKILTGAALEDFSPDGKYILYTTCDGKGELYVYGLKTKKAIKISQNLKITSANWSPNQNWIAVSALENDGSTNIYLISTMALGIIKVSNTPNINESFPVFAPNGKYLAYFTNKSGENKIEYYDIIHKKTQEPGIHGMFPWISPDGKNIVIERGKTSAIARVDGLNYKTLCLGKTPIWVK